MSGADEILLRDAAALARSSGEALAFVLSVAMTAGPLALPVLLGACAAACSVVAARCLAAAQRAAR